MFCVTNRTFITQHPKASKKAITAAYKLFLKAFDTYNIELQHHKAWEMFESICRVFEYMKGQSATEITYGQWVTVLEQEINPKTSVMHELHDPTDGRGSSSDTLYRIYSKKYTLPVDRKEDLIKEILENHDELVFHDTHKAMMIFELILSKLGIEVLEAG